MIKKIEDNNDSLPVYEAEIIYSEDEDSKELEKKPEASSPSIMHKLGLVAGSIASCIGFVSEIRSLFQGDKRRDNNCNSPRRRRKHLNRRRR